MLSSEYLNTDSVCAWLQQLFQNGGHQQRTDVGILETKFWLNSHQINTQQDNVFAPKDLYDDYVNYFKKSTSSASFAGDERKLSERLKELNKMGKIEFSAPRFARKTFKKLTGKDGTTGWKFPGIDRIRKIWVDQIWDGDEEGAWGSEYQPEDKVVPIRSVESEDFVQPQFSKKVEPDKQSVTPTPRPEEQFLTQDVDPYEDGALGDDWDFDDDY